MKGLVASFVGGGGLVAIFTLIFTGGERNQTLAAVEKKGEENGQAITAIEVRVRSLETDQARSTAAILTRLDDIARRLDRIERGR